MTSLSVRPSSSPPSQAATKVPRSPWIWAVAACVLLGASGGSRYWREWKFAALAAQARETPFPLKEMPRALGGWVSVASKDGRLDPQIARIAGSSDHILRSYMNEKSGDEVNVLVIYGLASHVFGHTPDVCYPAVGYQVVQGPVVRELKIPGLDAPAHFKSAIYMKRSGGAGTYEEVYHTFYHDGEWVPNAADRWKTFRYHPGMYKIQFSRNVSGLSDEVYGPSEDLLRLLIQEIMTRSGARTARPTPASGPPSALSGPGDTAQ